MRNTFIALSFVVMSVLVNASVLHAQVTVTNTTTSTAACVPLNRNLFYGLSDVSYDTGDIRQLQQFLISKKYLDSDLATGFFGNATLRAVKYYQAEKNIETTGFVDYLTRTAFIGETCGYNNYVPAPVPVASISQPVYTTTSNYYNSKLEVKNFSVKSGPVGTAVVITGSGFDRYNNTVIFGKQAISGITSADGVSIVFIVPDPSPVCPTYSITGCTIPQYINACDNVIIGSCVAPNVIVNPGTYSIYVENSNGVKTKNINIKVLDS